MLLEGSSIAQQQRRVPSVGLILAALALLAVTGCLAAPAVANAPPALPPGGVPGGASVARAAPVSTVSTGARPPAAAAVSPPQPGANPAAEPRVGFVAPEMSLETLTGEPFKLSDLRGKPIFVNFWATWCGPCKVEMPEIEQVYQAHQAEGLVVLGVDVQEPAAKVQDFLKPGAFSWTFVLDRSGESMMRYRVTGIPASFFIDRDGVIRDIVVGSTTRPVMEAKVGKLLN